MTAQQTLEARRKELNRKQAENALLQRQVSEIEGKIVKLVEDLDIGKEALSFLEELANSRRGTMRGRIESVITEALRLIYDDSYRAELVYSVKNNRSHLAIYMVRTTPDGEVRREMGGFGGGVADTMSVPLRLMVLIGAKQTDRVCVLDECWKHMDTDRIELVGKFVRLLTDKLGIQVIFCTHHTGLKDFVDKTYEVSELDGVSSVEVYG